MLHIAVISPPPKKTQIKQKTKTNKEKQLPVKRNSKFFEINNFENRQSYLWSILKTDRGRNIRLKFAIKLV